MPTFHLHIQGRVQGVGFRPAVASLAEARGLHGTVSNGKDGVHIYLHTCETNAKEFTHCLLTHLPPHAIVTNHHLEECITRKPAAGYSQGTTDNRQLTTSFSIIDSAPSSPTDLLLTPDIGLCPDCRAELTEYYNRRYRYAFTTCLHCGPRYSITTALPYDRVNTTMAGLAMCPDCQAEYEDIHDRRHYSQTNSCPHCPIPMHLYLERGVEYLGDEDLLTLIHKKLKAGGIVAVKGIGGFLLLADAHNADTIATLRRRKHRPHKPFAVLYPDLNSARQDVEISEAEAEALQSPVAPIVLCRVISGDGPLAGDHPRNSPEGDPVKNSIQGLPPLAEHLSADSEDVPAKSGIRNPESGIQFGLSRIGVMLPYTPLLQIISQHFNAPLIATSGNISGSPILYKDDEALQELREVADAMLTYEREIVTPQDDSVWQFTEGGERIILRRSRGMAPDYFPHTLGSTEQTIFAAGADLKSAFAVHHRDKIFISQYLGDLEDYRSQQAWNHTREHLLQLIEAKPAIVLTDLHPGYFSRQEAVVVADEWHAQLIHVPHHEAHIAAVLSENGLCHDEDPILGIAWDGTGYGTDGHAWGSETFVVEGGRMERTQHLDYFPQLMGDKMSREPRLSALSLLHGMTNEDQYHAQSAYTESNSTIAKLLSVSELVADQATRQCQLHFSDAEWSFYQKVLEQPNPSLTSSMGRLIDGVASILGVCQHNSYEGQAAMELEAMAGSVEMDIRSPYPFLIREGIVDWRPMLQLLLGDLQSGVPREIIARRFFTSLAQLVTDMSRYLQIPRIALSGGVFQNALLLDLIRQRIPEDMTLYTHQQLSPNDECIGLGQVAWYHFYSQKAIPGATSRRVTTAKRGHPSGKIHHPSSTIYHLSSRIARDRSTI